jgi:hypothetical protein
MDHYDLGVILLLSVPTTELAPNDAHHKNKYTHLLAFKVYGCPLTERPSTHSLKRECYLTSYIPSHSIYIHTSLSKVSLICPEKHPQKRVRAEGRKKKEERPRKRGEKKKAERKAKGDAWCGRKDQSISSSLGHTTTSPPSNKLLQASPPLYHTAHYTYKYKHTLLSFPLQVSKFPTLSPPQLLLPFSQLLLALTHTSYLAS